MRFTTRQMLIFVTGLAAMCGVAARGNYLFGPDGAVTYGTLFGVAIALTMYAVFRWHRWSKTERATWIVPVALATAGGFYVSSVLYHHGFDISHHKIREAEVIQRELVADPRFESVIITYEDPSDRKGEWLWVRGQVRTQNALDALHARIDDDKKWYVEWEVSVVPDT